MQFFGSPGLKSLYEQSRQPLRNLPKESTVEAWMDEVASAGISKVVCTGRDFETVAGWKIPNEYVAGIVNRYPDKVIGIAGIDPLKGKAAVLELERAITKLGLKGASIDPARCNLMINDRRLYPVYEKCVELDVPIFITMGPLAAGSPLYLKTVSPLLLDEVITDMKELKAVCSHAAWPFTYEMIAVAFRHRHVYIETSSNWALPGAGLVVEAANMIIPDKVVFATAYPLNTMRETVAKFQQLPFDAEILPKVMYDNAARLLKLDS